MTKIGAHVSGHPRHTFRPFLRAKPAGVLGLDDSDIFLEVDEENGGHSWKIYRTTTVYGERPSDLHDPPGTYAQMAHYWYFEASPSLKEVYDRNQKADMYIPDNEPTGGESEDPNEIRQNTKNVVAYERELMKLMNADGKKMGVLALAGGSPGDFDIWVEICIPFIKEAFDAGNYYVRHAYSDNWDRVHKEAQYLLDNGLGYGGMVVSEWGFNGGYGQNHDVERIKSEDAALMAYPNVIAFLLWEYGTKEWDANIDSIVPQLIPYMEANPTDKWQPGSQEPQKPTKTFKQIAWWITSEMQINLRGGLQLNPHAAIQEQIEEDSQAGDLSLQIVTSETRVGELTVQAAESRTGKVRRRVYVWEPEDGSIWWYEDPDNEAWLPVTPLSQRDPRWATEELGEPSGHDKTIGNWGCLLVVYNMQARYLGITGYLPDVYNVHMAQMGGFTNQYLNPGALALAHPDEIAYAGWLPREDPDLLLNIRESIDNDMPVPARVDFRPSTEAWEQHWVLVIGYIAPGLNQGKDFIMADPWTGKIGLISEVYDITGDDILEAIFYEVKTPEVPKDKVDILSFMRADPHAWRVVRHDSGQQEDIQDMDLGNGLWVRRKNDQGEWWRIQDEQAWLVHDTSPAPQSNGRERVYTLYKDGQPGAPKNPRYLQLLEIWFEDGLHTVQFRAKDNCSKLSENSGTSQNSCSLARYEANGHTFDRFGQNLYLDEVIWLKTGQEIQIYAKHNGLVVGWCGWSAPWGSSEPVEIHWDRGVMTKEPDRICPW